MSSPWHRTLRLTRRTLGYGALLLLILAALAVSVANLLLPFVEDNPRRVQAWLSERVGQPVRFDRSRTQWTRRGPRISLSGLKVGQGAAAVEIGQAELLVAVYSGLLPNHPLTELKAKDLHLRLEQQADDSWLLLGVPRQADSKADALDVLSGFGELQLERSDLTVRPNRQAAVRIPRIDMRLRVQGRRLKVGLRAEAAAGDAPLQLVAELDRREMSGRFWIGGKGLHARHWLALFPDLKVPEIRSQSRLDLWAELDRRRIMRVHGRLGIENLALASAEPARFGQNKNTGWYDLIETEWLWRRAAGGWQLQVPAVVFHKGKQRESLRGIRARAGDGRWQAGAEALDLQPFTVIMPLAKGRLPDLDSWAGKAGIHGQLRGIRAGGEAGLKRWRVNGYGSGLGFLPIGKAPGLRRIAGAFSADERGGTLRFKPDPMVLDWPLSFGRTVPGRFDGGLSWWRSGPDWVLGARDLRWRGEGMDLRFDTEMRFMPGAKAPSLALAAKLQPFDFRTAKRFWLRHLMPKASIDWLDMALVKGEVRDGSVLIAGDLAHWPFSDGAGRFSARATVLAEQMKFAADWPVAENAVLAADFFGPGFSATGSAGFLGNAVTVKPSGIASFRESELLIDVHADSEFARLMPVLKQTPLKAKVGATVLALEGSGPVSTDVRMRFPLKKGLAFNRIEGGIGFAGTEVRMPEWHLALQDARGAARFDNDGFSTAGLKGRMARKPVTLDLRVGSGHVRDKANYVESGIAGSFHTDTLLAFDPALADLKGVLKGQSQWRFGVVMPLSRDPAQAPVFLNAQSELVGTGISLPVPLRKSADSAQAFSLGTRLPLGQGPVDIRLGPDFRLLLAMPKGKPMAGIALFGRQTQGAIPAEGFSVRGNAEEFDVPAWFALARKAEGAGGLQSFDLNVNHFRLMGNDFGPTRLQRLPTPGAMSMRASGAKLEGSLSLPEADKAPISARFAKVHFGFPPLPPQTPAPAASPLDFGDPAGLPPIQLTIDDLRYGEVPFGRAELQTSPSPNGLLIRKLSTQSALLTLNASGVWQGSGAQARTSLQADIGSPDLGKLLTAARFGQAISRGKAKAQLSGVWNGAPTDFSLQGFNGLMDLRIDDGQILGVDPGGGRVLGLVSLAELPRRLSLDFRDFFNKGLAFSSVKGQFRFAQGKANTQNLSIDAPAADIRITGSTDLVREQFDQRVHVEPKAGGLLPVIGAVAAGPIGAAAGVVAQAVLDKPLKQGSAVEYRITGPWAKPDVRKTGGGRKP